MYKSSGLLMCLLVCMFFFPAIAQNTDEQKISLEDIFSNKRFSAPGFGTIKWDEEGGAQVLEKNGDEGRHLVRYSLPDWDREVIISTEDLIPEGKEKALKIASYQWSSDERNLLIFTHTRKVWRQNTRGDYWVFNLEAGSLHQIAKDADPSSLMFAKFSPKGNKVAYVRQNNLYVEDWKTGKVTPLTTDGSASLINGTFDWAYEEEFSCLDGFRWSPDGSQIAYWQIDASEVPVFHMINNTDEAFPKLIPFAYPKVGDVISSAKVGVVAVKGGETAWAQLPGEPREYYLPRMEWNPNGSLLIQQVNRHQNENKLWSWNPGNEPDLLYTDKDDAWLEVEDELHWLDNGKAFLWLSEQAGWKQVFKVNAKDGSQICLTPGTYDVISIVALDEKNGELYFAASPDNPTQQYLYRVSLNQKGEAERVTPDRFEGWNSYAFSPKADYAIHSYSRFGQMTDKRLIKVSNHTSLQQLSQQTEAQAKLDGLEKGAVQFFRVEIEPGVELDAYLMEPANREAGQKYPVICYVYTEPWGQTVKDSWAGNRYLWHLMLSQQGYAVMSIDNRGTKSPRGREWRKSIYQKNGILNASDQAAGMKATLEKFSFLDAGRVGVWGWSGGGTATLNALMQYPEVYHTGIAVAPNSDLRYYDAIYEERYMGILSENEEGYRLGSPVNHADKLEGDLLMIHGTGDDNVHYQHAELMVNALVKANKPFEMMAYPNRTHSIRQGKNTTIHLYSLMTRYFLEHLQPGPQSD